MGARHPVSLSLTINGTRHDITSDPDTPLVYVLRDELKLKGTKLGCGLEQCGACAVMVDGKVVLSCVTTVEVFDGKGPEKYGDDLQPYAKQACSSLQKLLDQAGAED